MVDVKKIVQLLKKCFEIEGTYKIDPNSGVVDVQGDVSLIKNNIQKLPVQFGHVDGSFWFNSKDLISLSGAPRYVSSNFVCYENKLTSLLGSPSHVGGDFYCYKNKLTSLAGAPRYVGGTFFCSANSLKNLLGAPSHVGGDFFCHENQLTSLAGAPDHVGSHFVITYDEDLPLLRLCVYNNVRILDGPNEVKSIMKKNAGQGKPGALKAAAELIRAGYAENARW